MRYVLCGECVEKREPGTRQIYARSEIGEPAEFERVTVGIARQPKPEQRWLKVNGVKEDLSLDYFNCDHCDREIRPGDRCGAWTVWTEDTEPIGLWEDQYLEPDQPVSPPDGLPDDPRLLPRRIRTCVLHADGSETLTFECGHSVTAIIPGLAVLPVPCAECISDMLRERRDRP